jgi:protein-disulfide isomerase
MSHFRVLSLSLACALCALTCIAQSGDAAKPKKTLATVDGQAIYEEDLAPLVEGQLTALRTQEYEIKRKALDSLVDQKLLEAAAKKKGLTTDQLLDQEVNSKVATPSDDEVQGFYLGVRDKVRSPYEDVKNALRESLKQVKRDRAKDEYVKSLRSGSTVAVLLSPPRVEVAFDPARVRGNPKAPIMIVEFSDYQCPYCHNVEPTVKQVLAKYGDKVSLSYRDFPLNGLHPQAQMAAEASRCALEQGKFWEYHDQLFKASNLDKDALTEYARDLKLDEKQFSSCLSSSKYRADVTKDLEEGRKFGITGTPHFFINGIATSGAQQQDAFNRIIDDELSRKR